MRTWNLSRDAVPPGHVQITIYSGQTGERIATVFESEETARLIAAAPELLAALTSIVASCEQGEGVCLKQYDSACEAILKARGDK